MLKGMAFGFALLAGQTALGGVLIDLRPDFSGAPFSPGDIVPVEIYVASDISGDTLFNMRQFMFDFRSNVTGPDADEIFLEPKKGNIKWVDDPFSQGFWFTDDPLPIPQANYVLPFPAGQLFDLGDDPRKVADVFVTFLKPGFLDARNPDAERNIDQGANFHSAFGIPIDGHPIRHFSSWEPGDVSGGRVFIPEPATLVLLIVGSGLLVQRRRIAA